MRVVIAGGSGFIGQKVTKLLQKQGHDIVILTRRAGQTVGNVTYVEWLEPGASPEARIRSADAFINLAGVSINDGRWSPKHQKQIYDSRMEATDELLRMIAALPEKPSVLINASAIGIYPASLSAEYTEQSREVADDFLGRTVHDWEQKAKQAEEHGVRTAFMRFGVVLGGDGGALPLMALPYKLFAGGTVGSGKQWVSWVHEIDVARAIAFAINNSAISGPVNVTSPSPTRMKEFGRMIGKVLYRPHWIAAPSFVMLLALGRKSALVLEGQHVMPRKLLEHGFEFTFPTLDKALVDLLVNNRR